MKIKIENETLIVLIIMASLLIASAYFFMAAFGIGLPQIMGLIKGVPSSGVLVEVDYERFENGSAIEWSNLQLGMNKKPIVFTCTRELNVSLVFLDSINGLTVSCPLNNTIINPNRGAEDFIVLTMTPEAGSNGAELSTAMYVYTEEVS